MTDERGGSENPVLEHATVVRIAGHGVIIRGPSGSGKTSLAIELMHRSRACGMEAALVADDYVFLSADRETGRLTAEAPERIAGLIEFRGFGVVSIAQERFAAKTRLHLAVLLTETETAERVADIDRRIRLAGALLPEMALPRNEPMRSAYAVFGWLDLADRVL
jgi:HPr kinase/phosphorylase